MPKIISGAASSFFVRRPKDKNRGKSERKIDGKKSAAISCGFLRIELTPHYSGNLAGFALVVFL